MARLRDMIIEESHKTQERKNELLLQIKNLLSKESKKRAYMIRKKLWEELGVPI